jgi:hypothetical protein
VSRYPGLHHRDRGPGIAFAQRVLGIPPAPERRRTTTWAEFVRAHLAVLVGTDFFTVEVLTLRGLVTSYVLFFIHLQGELIVPGV